jgi:hypothetical protein
MIIVQAVVIGMLVVLAGTIPRNPLFARTCNTTRLSQAVR